MTRRKRINQTGIPRISGVCCHDAWASFTCIFCRERNFVQIGKQLISAEDAFETSEWECAKCGFLHHKESNLPFETWPSSLCDSKRIAAQRYWRAFFRSATEQASSFWKKCNACGRILPFHDFSGHKGWGPLERQMECRACKAVINAKLNPKRTKQQLHDASVRRRAADLLLEGENRTIDHKNLFERFGGKCFKSGKLLKIEERKTWAIDHILPSKFLYPLNIENAALLSYEENDRKRARWPSDFYTNKELKALAKITGADLSLLARKEPVVNAKIDVDACVTRCLDVREKTDLHKRVLQLKQLIIRNDLTGRLSSLNLRNLGLQ